MLSRVPQSFDWQVRGKAYGGSHITRKDKSPGEFRGSLGLLSFLWYIDRDERPQGRESHC